VSRFFQEGQEFRRILFSKEKPPELLALLWRQCHQAGRCLSKRPVASL